MNNMDKAYDTARKDRRQTGRHRIRIGRIDYTNVWPIFYHFPIDALRDKMEIVSQVPAQLNKALLAGEIDIAAISSFAYGASYEQYVLLPDLSVSAVGKVGSILLFCRKPFAKVLDGTIAISQASATSSHLLKIIIEKFYKASPRYIEMPPKLSRMLETADAALLIGDDAIRASWNPDGTYEIVDLGELWTRLTGYGMSFALWAVRRETAERQPQLVAEIYAAFLRSKQRAKQDLGPLIRTAQQQIGGTPSFWHTYFNQLCYDFDERAMAGLELYFRYAGEMGLMPKRIPIRMWPDKSKI